MDIWYLIMEIVLLLGVAFLFGVVAQRLNQSAIVGYLLAGAVLGPIMFNKDAVQEVAELGVALLLFSIGLEFSFGRLRRMGTRAFLIGILQILITLAVFTLIFTLFGPIRQGLAMGAIIALSSTAIVLRVLVDRPESNARFLVLGSASPYLVKGASESLAGRIGFIDLSGFSLSEVGADRDDNLWNRGGFPRSFLAADDALSAQWRNDFIRTFLERDIPQLGITIPAETLRRFWTMIAHFHGQVWNAATFARSLGVSAPTARRYLDILSGAFMVRQIQPWHANIKKRQVKSPRIYLRDSGLLHTLLSLQTMPDVLSHPKVGASWEGFVIEEILASVQSRDFYFWSTYSGAELDGLLFRRGRAVGFEIKRTDAPTRTKSMVSAIQELDLEHLYVVYPGKQSYRVDNRITALSVRDLDGVLAGEG